METEKHNDIFADASTYSIQLDNALLRALASGNDEITECFLQRIRIKSQLIYSPKDIMAITGWGSTKVNQIMHAEDFPIARVNGSVFVRSDDFDNWLRSKVVVKQKKTSKTFDNSVFAKYAADKVA